MEVLACSIGGLPFSWISHTDAAKYYATGKVAWDVGSAVRTMRGGTNRQGAESFIEIRPVIAIANSHRMDKLLRQTIPLGFSNRPLFRRDRNLCAYCGQTFSYHQLSRDHIVPTSRGGVDTWMNCVTACRTCNQAKANLFVDDYKPLLYLPYVPCRYESYLLTGRNVIADQHDFLVANLPKHSRFYT